MGRFIVRHRGQGPKPEYVGRRIRGLIGAAVPEDDPRMLLVEAAAEDLRALFPRDEWLVSARG